jgi:N-acetylmuramoyl-L-alanine amidase
MSKLIVLDAGHGGHDSGASGFGILEKDVCLDRVLRTKKYLEDNYEDVKVLLTRNDDTFLSLSERAQLANEAKADIFISFHNNAFNKQARGFESFIHNNAPERTVAMQNMIHKKIMIALQVADRGMKRANFAVLRETRMPAILLEELFIDNQTDNRLLQSSSHAEKYVKAVVEGVAEFLGLKKKSAPVKEEVSDWAKTAWKFMKENEVLDGTRPKDNLTREEHATSMYRLYKLIFNK